MTEDRSYPERLVFGLDIGTRSIVGTVGYQEKERFYIVAQRVKEHETRAMLDGQIHDIHKVGETIRNVKEELEAAIGEGLVDVCIAAAGRVLHTISVSVEQEFPAEKSVTLEDMYSLTSMGIEEAYEKLQQSNQLDMKFYCVGYSVSKYYVNHYPISNPESHKAKLLSADMIATFLPDDVVDGLYKAVELAGLKVVNMTLEPIAAIQVAIPEMYRMLNIALVDVGAGTSDISITKDGSIVAFGMIPMAGDALTEVIAKQCLVDFQTAEKMKRDAGSREVIEYHDIMLLPQTIAKKEIFAITAPVIDEMARSVAEKIKELNGGKPVSAVFVVGGGGKLEGYTELLAKELGIQKERVALRGEEVMQAIEYLESGSKKDSLLVTPIGICLSFYEQCNHFIFVDFNGERIKLFDNNMLAVVDAALQAEFPNDGLFPKRGKELNYVVDQKARITRGQLGEAAVIKVNGENADINTPIKSGDRIEVHPSTAGKEAALELGQLPEFGDVLRVTVNENSVELPKFASVNGTLQSAYYDVKNGDQIEMLHYYSVRQIAEFMDVMIDQTMKIYVNNKRADMESLVYENFSVIWTTEELKLSDYEEDLEAGWMREETVWTKSEYQEPEQPETEQLKDDYPEKDKPVKPQEVKPSAASVTIQVSVNGTAVELKGKEEYVFVDVFEEIQFDLGNPQGTSVVTTLNGRTAKYMEKIDQGDVIEIYWKR